MCNKNIKCSRCNKTKSIGDFVKDCSRITGVRPECRDCTMEYKHSPENIKREGDAVKRRILQNPIPSRKQHKKSRDKLRNLILEYYSNGKIKCACCNEGEIKFLGIDHINGGGTKHRKSIKTNIYSWLKKNNFPTGFQVLCYNCNLAKGFYGKCPHQLSKLTD